MSRWQLKSIKQRDLFDVIKDPDDITWLSTVELPELRGFDMPVQYETCYFGKDAGLDESEVLEKYNTKEEAIVGHERYRIQFELEPAVEGTV